MESGDQSLVSFSDLASTATCHTEGHTPLSTLRRVLKHIWITVLLTLCVRHRIRMAKNKGLYIDSDNVTVLGPLIYVADSVMPEKGI
jgi:hypothetical protein